MDIESAHASFPRNQIIEFGGLPTLDAVPSRLSRDLRGRAAESLEDLDLPVPPHLMPDADRDAERLEAAFTAPASVAWWLPLIAWADDRFTYLDDHLRSLEQRAPLKEITALVAGGTFDHGAVADAAEEPITTPRPGGFVTPPRGRDYGDDAVALIRAAGMLLERAADLPNLRSLFLGEIDDDQIYEIEWLETAPVLQAFPQLTEFVLCAQGPLFTDLSEHTALRRLAVHGAMDPDEMAAIATCHLPALERLELWSMETFADSQFPEERDAFAVLMHTRTLPSLNHLALNDFTFIDETLEQLAGSPLLPRLRSLDLTRSTLTDKGADILLDAPAFRDLERLDLRRHAMTAETTRRVQQTFTAAGVKVDARFGLRNR